jgi:hypothetical protein
MSTFQELSAKLDCILVKKRSLQEKQQKAVDDIRKLFVEHDLSSGTTERWQKIAFNLYKNVITLEKVSNVTIKNYGTFYTEYFDFHIRIRSVEDFPECCSSKETLVVHAKGIHITKETCGISMNGNKLLQDDLLYAQCYNGHLFTIDNIWVSNDWNKLYLNLSAHKKILWMKDETLVALRLAKRQDVIDRRVSLLVHDFLYKPVTGFFPRFYAKKDCNEFACNEE